MRKLKRSVAHARMKKRGYAQVNKKKPSKRKAFKKSLFAEKWRDFIGKED